MIRDVVIHLLNDQPLLADLYDMPSATDVALVCTNLRSLNGKRPVFADSMDSVFLFPFLHIRFVEIPSRASGTMTTTEDAVGAPAPAIAAREPEPALEPDLEIDEDFLRRVREV